VWWPTSAAPCATAKPWQWWRTTPVATPPASAYAPSRALSLSRPCPALGIRHRLFVRDDVMPFVEELKRRACEREGLGSNPPSCHTPSDGSSSNQLTSIQCVLVDRVHPLAAPPQPDCLTPVKRHHLPQLHTTHLRWFLVFRYLVREELGSGGAALVEWRLETGRTHQIRVHAKHINTPLFGDDTYGGGPPQAAGRCARPAAGFTPQKIKSLATKLARPALHALTLGFVHPATGEELSFQTDPPEDFVTLVEALRTPPDLSKDDIKKALGYTTDDD